MTISLFFFLLNGLLGFGRFYGLRSRNYVWECTSGPRTGVSGVASGNVSSFGMEAVGVSGVTDNDLLVVRGGVSVLAYNNLRKKGALSL